MGRRGRLEEHRAEVQHAVVQLQRVGIAVERNLPDEVHRRLVQDADERGLVTNLFAELLHEGELLMLFVPSVLVGAGGMVPP